MLARRTEPVVRDEGAVADRRRRRTATVAFAGRSTMCASIAARCRPRRSAILGDAAVDRRDRGASPGRERTASQQLKLRTYFLARTRPRMIAARSARRADSHAERAAALRESFPTVMVMEEMPAPRRDACADPRPVRQARRARRAGCARRVCRRLPPDVPRNRLGLARWLVDPGTIR